MVSTRLFCHTIARTNRFAVLQTTIYYNNDSTGGMQKTEVEGTYPTRKAAREAAKNTLLSEEVTKEWFVEYDKDSERDERPYRVDVLIHTVAGPGENFKILVKAQPHSHQRHERKHHGKRSDLPQNDE